jgi:hypothetical protein
MKNAIVRRCGQPMTVIALLVASLALAGPALALPCGFFGTSQLDGAPANASLVEAYALNGTLLSVAKQPSAGFGHYTLAVDAPGQTVEIRIGGIAISQGAQVCVEGSAGYVNISSSSPITTTTIATSSPSGGGGGGSGGHVAVCKVDGICAVSEDAQSCPSDCGVKMGTDATANSTSTTVASSGTCAESWTCGEWSACAVGTQTRSCTDQASCGTVESKPEVVQQCEDQAAAPESPSIADQFNGMLTGMSVALDGTNGLGSLATVVMVLAVVLIAVATVSIKRSRRVHFPAV